MRCSIALAPRGDLMATFIEGDVVKLWSTRDLSLIRELPVAVRGKSIVISLSFAFQGQALLGYEDAPAGAKAVVWRSSPGTGPSSPTRSRVRRS